jgi:heat shock protein HslJ
MPDTSFPGATRLLRAWPWALATFALSLAACAGGPPQGGLVGTEWRLVEMEGQTLPDRPTATLVFTETGRVAGNGSCNRFFGNVTVSGPNIGFSQMGSTRMACPGPASELEPRYLGALQRATGYEIREGQLLIQVEGQTSPLRFVRTQH